jgi:hypothetical protein
MGVHTIVTVMMMMRHRLPMWFEWISINLPSMRYENRSFAFEISVLGKLAAEVAPVRTEGLFVCGD